MKKPLSERFSKGLKQWLAVLPFLAVGMTLFIVFVLYPQIKNIYIALTNYSIMPGSENTFVGISNFAKMFKDISTKGSDAYFFWIAFRNNILAVLVTVPGQLVLGLIVAVLIHNLKTGKNVSINISINDLLSKKFIDRIKSSADIIKNSNGKISCFALSINAIPELISVV